MSSAITAAVVVAGVGAYSANKEGKKNRQAKKEADQRQLAQVDQAKAYNEKMLGQARGDRDKIAQQFQADKRSAELDLQTAKTQGDQASVDRLTEELDDLETTYTENIGKYDLAITEQEDLLDASDKTFTDTLGDAETQDRELIDDQNTMVDSAVDNVRGNNMAVGAELDKWQGMDKPEGLDFAQSEVDSEYRDAEADMRRSSGRDLNEAERLSMAMNKATTKGANSGNMRKDFAKEKSLMVGNLAGQANQNEALGVKMAGDAADRDIGNRGRYTDARLDQNSVKTNQRMNLNDKFLTRKLQEKNKRDIGSLAAKGNKYDEDAARDDRYMRDKIDTRQNYTANIQGADQNLQQARNVAQGGNATASKNAADIYGNMASQSGAAARRNDAALASSIGTIGRAAGQVNWGSVGSSVGGWFSGGNNGGMTPTAGMKSSGVDYADMIGGIKK